MATKISIVMVADDRQFIRDIERASSRAGDIAGQDVSTKFKNRVSNDLANYQTPFSIINKDSIKPNYTRPDKPDFQLAPLPVVTPAAERQRRGTTTTGEIGGFPYEITTPEGQEANRRDEQKRIDANRKIRDANQTELIDIQGQQAGNSIEIDQLNSSDPVQKKVLAIEAQIVATNNKFDGIRNNLVDKFNVTSAARTESLTQGNVAQANLYNEQLQGINRLIEQNEVLRVQEVKILTIKRDQAAEAARRKVITDQATAAERDRKARGQAENDRINLEGQQAGNSIEIQSLQTSSPSKKVGLEFDSRIADTNRKFDGIRNDLVEKYNGIVAARQLAQSLGDGNQVNLYDGQLADIKKLVDQNEVVRAQEIKILEIKKQQAVVIAQRKAVDTATSSTRDNRDSEAKKSSELEVSRLQGQINSSKDPVAIAVLKADLANVRSTALRNRTVTGIDDDLADLNRDEARKRQNTQLGISDPKINSINFADRRRSLLAQKTNAEQRFEQEKVNSSTRLEGTLNAENKKSSDQTITASNKLTVEDLKSQIKAATSETVKIQLQFQLDSLSVEESYRKATEGVQENLNKLRERQTALGNTGTVSPELNKLIKDQEDLLARAEENKNNALKLLASSAIFATAIAQAKDDKTRIASQVVLETPRLNFLAAQGKGFVDEGNFAAGAAPTREAALGRQKINFAQELNNFDNGVAGARAAGFELPQADVDKARASIEQLNNLKIKEITQDFLELTNAVNSSQLAIRKLAEKETTNFLAELISGTKSFDDIWRKTAENVVQGMIKILAQNFAKSLFDGDNKKGSGGGLLSQAVNFVSGILGFEGGGIIGGEGITSLLDPEAVDRAIRIEGAKDAVPIIGRRGERVLNLEQTAIYNGLFPNGIDNAERGGVIGGGNSSSIASGSLSGGFGSEFNSNISVDLTTNGQAQPSAGELLGGKFTQAVRGILVNELRPSGVLARLTGN
jgi:hypothetical protein